MRKPGTSQLEIDEIRRILAKWEGGTESLALDKPVGRVYWVPGHCEVPGNEAVDQLAKAGCKSADLLVPERTMSLAAARRWKNDAFRADFKDWMRDNCPNTDHLGGALGLPRPYKVDWMKGLNRGTVARILAARSRHGDFEEYHTRFNHQDAEKRCQVPNCGKLKDFSHPWECMGNATRLAGRQVADAEAIAALKAVRAATEVAPSQAEGLNLCVDKLGVVKRIGRRMRKPGTSQLAIDETRRTLARWQGGFDDLALEKPAGKVHWVPGRCEVPGNEAASGQSGLQEREPPGPKGDNATEGSKKVEERGL
ncbi:putative double-stranded RNA/RNA-DNA hybrid binding protein [Ceratocystis lukuohia]|uniref:Double-stranded RNA/RNA-DNA hybrid binding protein n=1 Tax=Ceratocystis lukuohia TaxID=2019550 RepID=A0ABR4MMB6_9PEZI